MNKTTIIKEYTGDDTMDLTDVLQVLNDISSKIDGIALKQKKMEAEQAVIRKEVEEIHEKMRNRASRETNTAIRRYAIDRHAVHFIPSTTDRQPSIGELIATSHLTE